jgi:hypothetical protein
MNAAVVDREQRTSQAGEKTGQDKDDRNYLIDFDTEQRCGVGIFRDCA